MIDIVVDVRLALCILIAGIMLWSHLSWKRDTITKRMNTVVQSLAAISAAVVIYTADGSVTAIFLGFFAIAALVRLLFEPA